VSPDMDAWDWVFMALCVVGVATCSCAIGFDVGKAVTVERAAEAACVERCAPLPGVLTGSACGCVQPAPEGGR
jgi:hypothetical protein